jgi:sarcosine oxidase subunit delta
MDAVLPLDATPEAAARILYQRDNPRGFSDELWRHTHGCRAWLRLTRHTASHEITAVVAWPPA